MAFFLLFFCIIPYYARTVCKDDHHTNGNDSTKTENKNLVFTYRTPFLLGDWKFSATFITAYKVKDLLPLGTLEDRSIKLHRGKPSQVGPKREIDKRRGFSKGNVVQKHRRGGRELNACHPGWCNSKDFNGFNKRMKK